VPVRSITHLGSRFLDCTGRRLVGTAALRSVFPRAMRCRFVLFPKDFLHLADLLLCFAGLFLGSAFAFQLAIPGDFPGNLPDTALHFVKLAFRLVLVTGFHDISPFV